MKSCIVCNGEVEASLNTLLNYNFRICQLCFKKCEPNIKTLKISKTRGITLMSYNEFVKKLILQIKVNKDLALARELLGPFRHYLRDKYKGYTLIPVPSTTKSNLIRGFNHVKAIFELLELPILDVFIKAKDYKQTSMSLSRRNEIKSAIKLKPNILLPSKILVVDDIVTSGNSLDTCLALLKPHTKKLRFVVVANNCRKMRLTRNRFNTKV